MANSDEQIRELGNNALPDSKFSIQDICHYWMMWTARYGTGYASQYASDEAGGFGNVKPDHFTPAEWQWFDENEEKILETIRSLHKT